MRRANGYERLLLFNELRLACNKGSFCYSPPPLCRLFCFVAFFFFLVFALTILRVSCSFLGPADTWLLTFGSDVFLLVFVDFLTGLYLVLPVFFFAPCVLPALLGRFRGSLRSRANPNGDSTVAVVAVVVVVVVVVALGFEK